MTFHVTGHDPPCHVDPRERPSLDPSNPLVAWAWRYWAMVADSGLRESKGRGRNLKERERDVGDKVERVGESGADEREKE